MDVVEVLAQTCDGQDGSVCNVAAFGEDQVAESRSSIDYLLNAGILEFSAIGEVKDTQAVVRGFGREVKEGLVGNLPAVCQAQFAEIGAFCDQSSDGFVVEVLAVVEVDFENVAAVHGEGDDTPVAEL